MNWVSTKDALPIPWQEVIAWSKEGRSQIPNVMQQCSFVGGQFQHGYHHNTVNDVTHWLPMPEPPKETTDD